MTSFSKKRVFTILIAFLIVFTSSCQKRTETVELRIIDRVVDKTMAYLGAYGLIGSSQDVSTNGPSRETAEKYIKDSGFNTTKFWLRVPNFQELSVRSELYGANTKQTAVRQVTENPEKIDWDFELQIKKVEPELDLCNKYGFQPVLEMVAPFAAYRTYSDEPLVREVFWRYVFLFHYWANKVKKYDFILWNLGSENPAEAGIMQADVGSDAIREAEKLTGVKVRVGAPVDDWTIQDIIAGYEGILQSDIADRLDVLSFHTHNFFDTFPKKSEYPTFLEQVRDFDELQKKYRPGKALLPYWDTGGFWRTGPGSGGYQSDHLFAGLYYISRIIWSNQGRVEVGMISRMYGAESDSLYGKGLGGLIKLKPGSGYARPGRSYYAIRLIARAAVGAKDRLEVEGLPAGSDVLALASRDKERLYLTVINRTEETAYQFRPIFPAGLSDRPCTLREFSEKLNDEVVAEGSLPSRLELKPLSAKQIIIDF